MLFQTLIPLKSFKQKKVFQQTVNVASRDGLSGSAGYAAYSASKSAVL